MLTLLQGKSADDTEEGPRGSAFMCGDVRWGCVLLFYVVVRKCWTILAVFKKVCLLEMKADEYY